MTDSQIFSAIITGCFVVLASIITFFLTNRSNKKKNAYEIENIKVETESNVLDNLIKSKDLLAELTKPLQDQINELKKQIEELKKNVCYKTNCTNRQTN